MHCLYLSVNCNNDLSNIRICTAQKESINNMEIKGCCSRRSLLSLQFHNVSMHLYFCCFKFDQAYLNVVFMCLRTQEVTAG